MYPGSSGGRAPANKAGNQGSDPGSDANFSLNILSSKIVFVGFPPNFPFFPQNSL